MLIPTSRMFSVAVLSAVLLAGCGGGGGGGDAPAGGGIGQNVGALVAFISAMIAGTDETSEPIDIDALTLVADDSGEPAPL